MSVRRYPSLVAALLVLCLVLTGIAPSVSRTLALPGGHDLCTTDGRASGPMQPGSGGSSEVACALCLPHGGTDASPVPCAPLAFGLRPVVRPPGAGPLQVAAKRVWSAGVPRGPPAWTDG